MRQMKRLTPFIIILAIIFALSACGSGLEKPTGLENTDNEQIQDNQEEVGLIDEEEAADTTDKTSNDLEEVSPSNDESEDNITNDTEVKVSDSDKDKQGNKPGKSATEKKEKSAQVDKKSTTDSKSTSNKTETKKKHEKEKTEDKTKPNTVKPSTTKPNTTPPKKGTESKEPKPSTPEPEKKKDTVTISIVVSSSEVILQSTEYEIQGDESALQALSGVTKDRGISREILSSGYVKGIGGIREFDRGNESGWMYSVNGVFPSAGARSYALKAGDRVEWLYTLDLGKDIGAK